MCYCFNPFIQFSVSQAWLLFTCTKLSILKVLLYDIHVHLSCFKAAVLRLVRRGSMRKGWERQEGMGQGLHGGKGREQVWLDL